MCTIDSCALGKTGIRLILFPWRYDHDGECVGVSRVSGAQVMSIDSSLVTVGAACLFGISLALRAELKDHSYRVNEVRLFHGIGDEVGNPMNLLLSESCTVSIYNQNLCVSHAQSAPSFLPAKSISTVAKCTEHY